MCTHMYSRPGNLPSVLQFVLDLNEQYAPTLAGLQQNASFDVGELVEVGSSAAVHIFSSAFDSLLGPQFRYEIYDSTAYCGTAADVVPSAQQLATANGPDVIADSTVAGGNNVAEQLPSAPGSVEGAGGEVVGSSGAAAGWRGVLPAAAGAVVAGVLVFVALPL